MAQFDIHRTPGPRGKVFPYLLVVQCGRYDNLATRLCAPLLLRTIAPPGLGEQHVTPSFVVEGQHVFLNPFDITPVPAERLEPVVASFADDGDARNRVIRAVDEAISQA